jgi:Fe2+ transport system protein FeoA
MNRCPSCDYEFTDRPRVVSWLGRLFGRGGSECAKQTQATPTVCDMEAGQRARVKGVLTSKGRRHNTLATFGLVAGSDVELVQRRPEYVVRVGETELALDADIARDILIEPWDDTASG